MFIGYKEVVELEDFEPARPEYLGGSQDGPDPYAKYTMLFVTESGPDRRGTFAQVDKVMNSSSEYFALKRLRPMTMTGTLENDATVGGRARDAFDEEYRTQLDLSNLPCFPDVFGRGTAKGDPAILMEWVEGETVEGSWDTLCTDVGPDGVRCAPGTVVAALGVSVLEALLLAGRLNRRLVHRDISPRNIMLRVDRRPVAEQAREGSFDVCLIDFGSSTLVNDEQDSGFTALTGRWRWGTPEYAPPEMLTNHIANVGELRRSQGVDVYALCSVLYELYAGHTPYRLAEEGVPEEERSYVKVSEAPHPLLARNPSDQGLVEAIMSGIRASQAERVGVRELRDQLVAWLGERDPNAPGRAMRQSWGLSSGLGPELRTLAAQGQNEAVAAPARESFSADAPATDAPASSLDPSRILRSLRESGTVSRRAVFAGVAALAVLGVGIGAASLVGALIARDGASGEVAPDDAGAVDGEADGSDGSDWSAPAELAVNGTAEGVFPAQGADTDLWGFARADGSWWIEPVFQQAPSAFYEGLACALDPNGWGLGYIDESGSWAIEPSYFSAGNFSEGLAAVKDESGQFGYINSDGEWVIEPAYVDVRAFSGGLATAAVYEYDENGNWTQLVWGYVRPDGTWAIDPVYYDCTSFSGGIATVAEVGHRWHIIDEGGNVLYDESPGMILGGFSAGLCSIVDGVTSLRGYIDETGDTVIETQFADCHPFVDIQYVGKRAPAKDADTGLWGIIDDTGAWVSGCTPRFVDMGPFENEVAPAKSADGNLWGYVSYSGGWVVQPRFREVRH